MMIAQRETKNSLDEMSSAKSEKRAAASNVVKMVVGVCHMEFASVFSCVVVRVPDQ